MSQAGGAGDRCQSQRWGHRREVGKGEDRRKVDPEAGAGSQAGVGCKQGLPRLQTDTRQWKLG